MAPKSDLRDFGVVGEEPTIITNIGGEQQYLDEVNTWKRRSRKKGTNKPLSLYNYPGKRVVEMPNGDLKVIKWSQKKGAYFEDFETYKNSLIKDAKIPKALLNKIKATEGQLTIQGTGVKTVQHGAAKNFAEWFTNDIMRKQINERDFWNRLGALYQEYGFEPKTWYGKSSVGRDLSHFHPKIDGGRFTFVEHWLANQSRGAKTFIDKANLQQAQIPITYEDLFDHYQNIVLGGEKPWYGSLNNLNLDDINALARGESVPEVALRRQALNQILTEAGNPDIDEARILQLDEDYKRLIQTSIGKDYLTSDNSHINLREDWKMMQANADKGTSIGTGFIDQTDPNTGLAPQYVAPEGSDIKGFDVDVDQGGPKADIKGRHILSGGLTIGGLSAGGIAKGLAGEVTPSLLNPKTGHELGVLASGKGDMSNVQGAVQGVGEDLLGGGIVTGGIQLGKFGWKKALSMAGQKGATHFAGKTALGKFVPYVGWGLLAYGAYDTADAFTEGLTGKGLNKRIGETYQRIIDEEFDLNRKWTDRHSKEEQDIANLTTM